MKTRSLVVSGCLALFAASLSAVEQQPQVSPRALNGATVTDRDQRPESR